MVCQPDKIDTLNKYFESEIIDQWDKCMLVVIKDKKIINDNK